MSNPTEIIVNLDIKAVAEMAKEAGAHQSAIYQIMDIIDGRTRLEPPTQIEQIRRVLAGIGLLPV